MHSNRNTRTGIIALVLSIALIGIIKLLVRPNPTIKAAFAQHQAVLRTDSVEFQTLLYDRDGNLVETRHDSTIAFNVTQYQNPTTLPVFTDRRGREIPTIQQ